MAESKYTALADYFNLLATNRLFLLMWIGEVVNQFGSWFNYVASFKLVEELTGNVGLAMSFILVVRSAPRMVGFAVAGGVADTFNRAWVLIGSCLAQALILLAFPLVQVTRSIWLLYALTFLQFSFETLYDPAKSALMPAVVGPDQLHIAAALDSFAWSLMAAVGSGLGGFAVAWFGAGTCFIIDAATFVVAAACASWLIPAAAGHKVAYKALPTSVAADTNPEADQEDRDDVLLTESDLHLEEEPPSLRGALSQGISAIARGFAYIGARPNRDVAVLIFLKASGGLIWGAADIIHAQLATLPGMQLWNGDPATTLGLLFSAVGVGCILGPTAANAIVPATSSGWLRAAASAHLLLALGYMMLLLPASLVFAVIGSVMRAAGSNILWIYSTTLLQRRVDPATQGSVFATEMALYTSAYCISCLSAGTVFQQHLLSAQGLSAIVSIAALLLLALWSWYAMRWSAARAALQHSRDSSTADLQRRDKSAAGLQHCDSSLALLQRSASSKPAAPAALELA